MADNINIIVNETIDNIVVNPSITNEIIDVEVFATTEEVNIEVTPSLTIVNINSVTGGGLVTSVNGQIGDVEITIPTKTSDLTNDGEDGTHPFITLEDLPPTTIPTIQEVTDEGNVTTNDISVNKLNLYDSTNDFYTKLQAGDNSFKVLNGNNKPIISAETGNLTIYKSDNVLANIGNPNLTETRDYLLPNQSGTIALTSDIPIVTGFVPYTGATQDVNLGEFGIQLGNLEFDNTPTNVPTSVGSLVWNDTAGTLDLKLKGGAVTLQIGQETVARVVNKTATNITLLESKYQVVRVTGAQGQRPKVDLALANNDLNSTTTLGLVTENILNNQEGFITTSGQVQQINTTGSLQGETWADGDVLYLSGTVAGQATNIKPIAPIHTVILGFVEYAHITQGKIFVKVDNGYELEELHNVSAIAPNNNEVLTYDSATLLWKPKSVFQLPSLTNGSVLFSNGTTIAQKNSNFFWDDTNNRLGIGTNTPTARFQIKAPGALSTDIALRVRNSADSGDLITVNGLGNVGIGITTPAGKLDLYDSTSSNLYVRIGSVGANWITSGTQSQLGTYTNHPLIFKTNDTARMRIVNTTGNVLINTVTDIASSKLTVESTTQGFLPPRMTNAQRLLIATPAVGLCVYCTDVVEGLYINKSTGWTYIG